MYEPSPRPVEARLGASDVLLLAGLRRLARRAGLRVVEHDDRVELSVRTPDAPRVDAAVDVVIGPNRIVLTITEEPDAKTWQAVQVLMAAVFE